MYSRSEVVPDTSLIACLRVGRALDEMMRPQPSRIVSAMMHDVPSSVMQTFHSHRFTPSVLTCSLKEVVIISTDAASSSI